MARPRKNPLPVTLEEKEAVLKKNIEDCQNQIAELKEKIKASTAELDAIAKEKEAKVLKEIQDAIAASGKTVEEWIAAIKNDSDK